MKLLFITYLVFSSLICFLDPNIISVFIKNTQYWDSCQAWFVSSSKKEIYKKCSEAPQENYNFSRTASYIWILRDLRLGKCKIRNKRERESSNNVIVITTGLINSDSYCLKYMRGEEGGRREVEQNAITSNYSKTIVSHFPGN